MRIWDGFGINYVETSHTDDYETVPQEYGGVSLLDEDEKGEIIAALLDAKELQDAKLTPGETSNWFRFAVWGYADAIADDEGAIANLGLITSHGFCQ